MDMFADWRVWLLVVVAAIFSVVFGLPTYYLGRQGMPAVKEKFPEVPDHRWQQAERLFERWKSLILMLTIVPGLGTVLPPMAGAQGVGLGAFVLWVFVAKVIRWWIIILITFGGVQVIKNR